MSKEGKGLGEDLASSAIFGAALWLGRDQIHLLTKVLRTTAGTQRARMLATALMARFGSVPAILRADHALLTEVAGVGPATARLLHTIMELAEGVARQRAMASPYVLSAWSDLIDYLHVTMAYLPVEQSRVLFLDCRNRLIADEVQHTGTIDHVQLYPREVVKRALHLSATAIIVVHNHPSGDPMPSSADLRRTRELFAASRSLGITLHDHVIIGKMGHISLRALKLL